jgi:hypothetical protein
MKEIARVHNPSNNQDSSFVSASQLQWPSTRDLFAFPPPRTGSISTLCGIDGKAINTLVEIEADLASDGITGS